MFNERRKMSRFVFNKYQPIWMKILLWFGYFSTIICLGTSVYFFVHIAVYEGIAVQPFWFIVYLFSPIIAVVVFIFGIMKNIFLFIVTGMFLAGVLSVPGIWPANILAIVVAIVLAVYHTVTHTWRAAS